MERHEAEELVLRIEHETGLPTRVIDEGDDVFSVEIDPPLLPGELRATVTASDPDDWPWLYETHIRPRLTRPPTHD
ncbi:MAG: hypothetical protein QOJ23_2897 [Actinomycetota bacterium]|nr:hypothetical protein [Actinomycetota bacterium]